MTVIPIAAVGSGNLAFTITDGTNLVLSTALTSAGYAGNGGLVEVTLEGTIGTSGSGVALTVDDTGADILIIYNNADIYGFGGAGGNGAPAFTSDFTAGSDGGVAVNATAAAQFVNNGSVNGGGGGGGGADAAGDLGGGGGGGGAGIPGGAGGSGGGGTVPNNGTPGASGTQSAGGAAGTRYGTPGAGGGLGQAGTASDGAAGSAGNAFTGYSNLTYSGSGTVNGGTSG